MTVSDLLHGCMKVVAICLIFPYNFELPQSDIYNKSYGQTIKACNWGTKVKNQTQSCFKLGTTVSLSFTAMQPS